MKTLSILKSRWGVKINQLKKLKMNKSKQAKTLLIWIPTLTVTPFFIQNGIDKVLHYNELNKFFLNNTGVLITGIILLIATALFLYHKTLTFGAGILAFYMTMIVGIHIYKDKAFLLASLIVVVTIFAAYLRRSKIVNKWTNN